MDDRQKVIAFGLATVSLLLISLRSPAQIYYHPTPGTGLHFDYWSRCKDENIEPERRMRYCRSILGGGHGDDAGALTQIGHAYMEEEKYDRAIDAFKSARNFYSTDFVSARLGLDEAFALDGQYDLAIANADSAIKSDPGSPAPYNERCWLRGIAGKELDAGLADCNKALALAPDAFDILDSRGLVEFKLGKLKDAAADYGAALDKDPKLASSLFMRGVIKLKNGDTDGGNADIEAAKRRNPQIAETFAAYGISP